MTALGEGLELTAGRSGLRPALLTRPARPQVEDRVAAVEVTASGGTAWAEAASTRTTMALAPTAIALRAASAERP